MFIEHQVPTHQVELNSPLHTLLTAGLRVPEAMSQFRMAAAMAM